MGRRTFCAKFQVGLPEVHNSHFFKKPPEKPPKPPIFRIRSWTLHKSESPLNFEWKNGLKRFSNPIRSKVMAISKSLIFSQNYQKSMKTSRF